MKASDYIALYLESKKISFCFEVIGGMITHIVDSISTKTNIKLISCHHEQTAGFAAEGLSRVSDLPGIALATSGPGATNLITSIASCFFDSTPTIFITGQVNTFELSKGKGVRQLGFQETDIIALTKPITKFATQVIDAENLPEVLDKAFQISISGRKGPCLIDIPMNIQSQIIKKSFKKFLINKVCQPNYKSINSSDNTKSFLFNLLEAVRESKKPLVLLGGGASSNENREFVKEIVQNLSIPVVLSLMGVDLLPENNNLRTGFIGSYGNRWANIILGDCDLLIVVGSRLDIRQTGSDIKSFCEGKKIWQIDIDNKEIGLRVKPDFALNANIFELNFVLKKIIHENPQLNDYKNKHELWIKRIKDLKCKYPAIKEYKENNKEINPIKYLKLFSQMNNKDTIYVTDVGQHQMWAAQSISFGENDRFITSGGMGAMGFGLPASIGSSFNSENKEVVLITGDGSFQVNIQELQTIKRNNLKIKIILFNNNCHGMVRQFQESYFDNNLQSTLKGYSAPNFSKIAEAYNLESEFIENEAQIQQSINKLINTDESRLVEIQISSFSKVYPKLAFGRRFGEMEPDVKPSSMEST